MINNLKYLVLFICVIVFIVSGCERKFIKIEDNHKSSDLGSKWKFSIGDNLKWADKEFDDSEWETIRVPSSWEDQGFNGYDGYAWYRKHFKLDSEIKGYDVYLNLGRVDDVEQTFVNGHLVGFTGSFPPYYQSAYYVFRKYYIPPEYLNQNGDNVIAVRVFDYELSGGILEGYSEIEIEDTDITPDFNLAGIWKFNLGDDPSYSKINYQDSGWEQITVPSKWDLQGYSDYDGFAWYRREFTLPDELTGKDFNLLMGKIDDIDQTYVNGFLVGSTGDMNSYPIEFNKYNEYLINRSYNVPSQYLKEGKNVIAVRVFDGFKDGGIYLGPVGLITNEKFTSFWRKLSERK